MMMYQREVESADFMLRKKDAALGALQKEVTVLRRSSCGSSSAASTPRLSVTSATSTPSKRDEEDHDAPDEDDDGDNAYHGAHVDHDREEICDNHDGGGVASKEHENANGREHLQVGVTRPEQTSSSRESFISYEQQSRERLRRGLERYFASSRARHKGDPLRLASTFAGERTPELWAMLARDAELPPYVTVRWLSQTQDRFAPVQWAEGKVPEAAREALQMVASDREGGRHEKRLREALRGNLDAVRALAFGGCPVSLRADVWRAMLIGNTHLECEKYHRLRAQAKHSDDPSVVQFRHDIAADARLAWRGQPFMSEPGVFNVVTTVALAAVLDRQQHTPGCCEIAALLLFALRGTTDAETVELQVFYCLVRVLNETDGDDGDDARLARCAGRVHALIRVYDTALAELLTIRGIATLPGMRLGLALCTKAGFAIADCARLWDTMLADVRRFEFCDCIVVALLLCCRRELFAQRSDAGMLAETMLAAPRSLPIGDVLRTAHAVCAFERRCGMECRIPYPRLAPKHVSRGHVPADFTSSAVGAVSSLWGKMLVAGAGALEAVTCTTNQSLHEQAKQRYPMLTV